MFCILKYSINIKKREDFVGIPLSNFGKAGLSYYFELVQTLILWSGIDELVRDSRYRFIKFVPVRYLLVH